MTKRKINVLIILLTLAFSLLCCPLRNLFPIAKATYVEGEIGIDTVWTLVDSPFVVSKNVTVREGVTLTIEPGVEIKFGGPFSLIVNGKLVAKGTDDKWVRFTSNKDDSKTGDWGTLLFNGTWQSSSLLEYCVVEYGTNGITVNGGTVTLRKSVIQLNLKNGIEVLKGSITVEQNVIRNNEAGITVSGGDVTIHGNDLTLNEDGIVLTGNLSTSSVTVYQNNIFSNKNDGVSITMNYGGSISIINNRIYSNLYGFHVSTDVATFITRNYIYNNAIGAFYEQGQDHVIRFNDIYDNSLGMDISSNATVDASKNYWGDRSGPYHATLNPLGKGNPVGGNGVNLDFLFFLTAPIDYTNSPPKAVLWTDKTVVASGQEVTFIGSFSHDDGRVDQYFYDFGDGSNSDWTTLSLFIHKYSSTGEYHASLRVMDDFGDISQTASATVYVVNLPSLNVKLTPDRSTVHSNEEIPITVYVSNNNGPVEGANVTFFSVKGGRVSPSSNLTDSSGRLTAIFHAPNVTDITEIRIIARASMEGYADGSSFVYLKVIPPLTVNAYAAPQTVQSEEYSTVNVQVKWSGIPVPEALVTISSAGGGEFVETEKLTDSKGEAVFTFKVPPVSNETNIAITAHASKTGYLDGEGQTVITVRPKLFSLQVIAEKETIISEETVNVTVNVKHEGFPVENVSVTISADHGEFFTATMVTDARGNATFTFRAPPALQETSITITATASKLGYASAAGFTLLTVKPGNLSIAILPNTYSVASREQVSITVYVKCDGRPVVNATVRVEASGGMFAETSASTDQEGRCDFTFWAPETHESISVIISVSAAKSGYIEKVEQIGLQVIPEAGGIPWTTLLLVLIPVVLAIMFVVLVKLGVITISVGEEVEETE
ncbi:MAG: PKD domain-containing protein [Candidatus Bathyarchaeia archaeon]